MKKLTKIKSIQSTTVDSSFEEEISELYNELQPDIKTKNEPQKKYFEDYELNEIYDFIDEINKSEIIDMNKIFKKEKEIIIFPDENSEKEDNECEEILNIYKNRSPFKPLKSPRKVSLIGKVLINDCVNNNNKESKK